MARITVEDCMTKIENIFDMILLASKRAKRIANGAEPLVERENDKPKNHISHNSLCTIFVIIA